MLQGPKHAGVADVSFAERHQSTTYGVIVGMAGSGKTGLGDEAALVNESVELGLRRQTSTRCFSEAEIYRG